MCIPIIPEVERLRQSDYLDLENSSDCIWNAQLTRVTYQEVSHSITPGLTIFWGDLDKMIFNMNLGSSEEKNSHKGEF